jgi:hypothetical protein
MIISGILWNTTVKCCRLIPLVCLGLENAAEATNVNKQLLVQNLRQEVDIYATSREMSRCCKDRISLLLHKTPAIEPSND